MKEGKTSTSFLSKSSKGVYTMTYEALNSLLNELSIEEKVGQLVQWIIKQTKENVSGSITGPSMSKLPDELLEHYSSILNFTSPEESTVLQAEYLASHAHPIPLLFMMDVVHGYKTIYPIPLALAGSFNPSLMEECSRMAAKEASAGGIHVTFAPMVDHVRDSRWGRVMESGGEDPYLTGIMGAAQIKGFHGNGLKNKDAIATCVKHFAGYGAPEGGKDYYQTDLSEHVMREWYLPAYKACLDAGADMVMPSFNSVNGLPSVVNTWLIQDILRDEWKFNGVIDSDYNAIGELTKHGLVDNKEDAACLSIKNECDLDMFSGCYAKYLAKCIRDGRVSMEVLDRSVMRVLQLKNALGLFEDPYRGASTEKLTQVCLSNEHRKLAKQAAIESSVLLKNEGILPFSKDVKKIALIGPFANNNRIIGNWSCNGDVNDVITVEQGIRALLPNAEITCIEGCSNQIGDHDTSSIKQAVAIAADAECVILCIGEDMIYTGEYRCRATLTMPGVQTELVRQVTSANPRTAVLLFNGRPLELADIDNSASAILEMWMPGTEGGNAAAEMLFGYATPSGKLSISFPMSVGQLPLFYARSSTGRPKLNENGDFESGRCGYMDCGNLPLYSFGYGLSYTTFEYISLQLEHESINLGDDIKVIVTIKNTGRFIGSEIVQVYINDLVSSIVTPIQKLAAFQKVTLVPGESRAIELLVSSERMMLWNANNEHVIEPGEFEISTGWADHLIFTSKFKIEK